MDRPEVFNVSKYADPKSVVAEAFRTVRTSLNYAADRRTTKVLMVTSPGPDEGKTLAAINIAASYARSGERVLLLDGDLRKPTCHREFALSNQSGLTNVLVDSAVLSDVVQDTSEQGLHVLTSGPTPPNPAELLDSAAMERLLDMARKEYDHVVIDSPPALVVADASILASKVDGIILVLVSGATRIDMAQETKNTLEGAKGRILGVVLNKVKYGRPYYRYRYYHYGESGKTE